MKVTWARFLSVALLGLVGCAFNSDSIVQPAKLAEPSIEATHSLAQVLGWQVTATNFPDSSWNGQESTIRCQTVHPIDGVKELPSGNYQRLQISDTSVLKNLGVVDSSAGTRIWKVKSFQSTDTWKSTNVTCAIEYEPGSTLTTSYGIKSHRSTTQPRPVALGFASATATPIIGATSTLGITYVGDQRGNAIGTYTLIGDIESGNGNATISAIGVVNGISLGVDTLTFSVCAPSQVQYQSACGWFSRAIDVKPTTPSLTASLWTSFGYSFARLSWSIQSSVTGYRVWRKCVENPSYPNAMPWEAVEETGSSLDTYDEASAVYTSTYGEAPSVPYFAYYVEALSPTGLASGGSYIRYVIASGDPMGC